MKNTRPTSVKVIEVGQSLYKRPETACQRWANRIVMDNYIKHYRLLRRGNPHVEYLLHNIERATERAYRRALPYFQKLIS